MRFQIPLLAALVCVPAAAQDQPPEASLQGTIDRGLAFLVKDALAWKEKHNCASCHHAALVVWSMREAKLLGHAVDEPVLAELTKWLTESGEGKVGLPRPEGRPKAFNSKALYFSLALGIDPQPDAVAQQGLKTMLETVKGDQIENGSWVTWPDTRPPIFGTSDDTLTTLATLALLPAAAAGDESAKAARDKGLQWLVETKTDDDPQSIAMRLVLWQRTGRPAEECQALVRRILERQNADGGWSQTTEMASDAWATGQALYALAHAGLKPDDPAVTRAQLFLIQTQREDGSWAMQTRPTKAGDPVTPGGIAITGGGSAWAVLGLVRSKGAG